MRLLRCTHSPLFLIILTIATTKADYNQTIDDHDWLINYGAGQWFSQSLAKGDTFPYLSWTTQHTLTSTMAVALEAVLEFDGMPYLVLY